MAFYEDISQLKPAAEAMRRKDIMDGLSEWDRKMLGRACRVEIPLTDQYTLRRIADLLRGLAATLDTYSRRTDLTERMILLGMKGEIQSLNNRIRELHGIEKFNKNGSTKNGDNS